MEQVNFNSHSTNQLQSPFVLLNGQTIILENGTSSTGVNDLSSDILQEALDNIAPSIPKNLEGIKNVSLNCNTFDNSGFFDVDNDSKQVKSNLIGISLQDAVDLGMQFSLNDTAKSVELNSFDATLSSPSTNGNFLFQTECLNKLPESLTQEKDFITKDCLSDLPQFPFSTKDHDQGFTFIPHLVDGQITYQIQIPEIPSKDGPPISQADPVPVTSCTLKSVDLNCPRSATLVSSPTVSVFNAPSQNVDTPVQNKPLQGSSVKPKIVISSKPKGPSETKQAYQPTRLKINGKQYIVKDGRKIILQQSINRLGINNNTKKIIAQIPKPSTPTVHNYIIKAAGPDPSSKKTSVIIANRVNVAQTHTISGSNSVSAKQILTSDRGKSSTNDSSTTVSSESCKPICITGIVPPPTTVVTERPLNSSIVTTVQPDTSNNNFISSTNNQSSAPSNESLAKKIIAISNGNNTTCKLTQSQLQQIAAVLEKNKSTTAFDTETNTRIVCRILYPDDFSPGSEVKNIKNNLKKRGRPGKDASKETVQEETKYDDTKVKHSRTRCGRVSRPPKHVSTFYKIEDLDESQMESQNGTDENNENSSSINLADITIPFQTRNISSQFRCPKCNKTYLSSLRRALHFEKYPDHRCNDQTQEVNSKVNGLSAKEETGKSTTKNSTLKKGSSGKGKPKRIPLKNISLKQMIETSDKKDVVKAAGAIVASTLSSWDLILLRLENVHKGKGQVAALIEELECIAQEAKKVSQQILKVTDQNTTNTIKVEDESVCSLLGIEKGHYIPNDSAFTKFDINVCDKGPVNNNVTEIKDIEPDQCKTEISSEYSVKEALEDSAMLTDIYTDQAGLESVDQIVNERLETLAPVVDELMSNMPPLPTPPDDLMDGLLTNVHPEPLTDNLFSHTTVPDPAEELYKSLENFAVDIQPNTQLDFTDLHNEFESGSSAITCVNQYS